MDCLGGGKINYHMLHTPNPHKSLGGFAMREKTLTSTFSHICSKTPKHRSHLSPPKKQRITSVKLKRAGSTKYSIIIKRSIIIKAAVLLKHYITTDTSSPSLSKGSHAHGSESGPNGHCSSQNSEASWGRHQRAGASNTVRRDCLREFEGFQNHNGAESSGETACAVRSFVRVRKRAGGLVQDGCVLSCLASIRNIDFRPEQNKALVECGPN